MTRIEHFVDPLEGHLARRDDLEPVDALLVCGTFDLEVPRYACRIWRLLEPQPILVIVSGRSGLRTANHLRSDEHEAFRTEMLALEPAMASSLVAERNASNTRENIEYSLRLASGLRPEVTSWGIVTRELQARRTFLTFRAQSSIAARSYPATGTLRHPEYGDDHSYALRVIAEFDRLEKYARLGDVASEDLPPAVLEALREARAWRVDRLR